MEQTIEESVEPKVGSSIRHGIATSRNNRGRPVIISRNDKITTVDGDHFTTKRGVKLHRSQLVGSRSNIEKHGDWNLIKEDSFGTSFAAARAAGKTTFDFGGKSFTTRKAGENDSTWKSSLSTSSKPPVPLQRPTSLKSAAPVPKPRPRPNITKVATRPDAPVGSMPAARQKTTVASRPPAPVGSMPAAKPKVRPNPSGPVGGVRLPVAPKGNTDSYVRKPGTAYDNSAKNAAETAAARIRTKSAAETAAARIRKKLATEARLYPDNEPYTGGPFDPMKFNANSQYKNHFHNYKTAQFFHKHGTTNERIDGAKDMAVAEKKMKYWQNQPHFDKKQGDKDHAEVTKTWKESYEQEMNVTDIEEGKTWKASDYRATAAKKLRQKQQRSDADRGKSKRSIDEDSHEIAKKFMQFRNKSNPKSTAELVKAFHEKGGTVKKGETAPMDSSLRYSKPVKAATVNVAALKDPNGAAASKKLKSLHAQGKTYRNRSEEVEITEEQDGVYRTKTAAHRKFSQMTGHEHKGFNYWTDGKKSPVTAKDTTGKPANSKYKLRVVGEAITEGAKLIGTHTSKDGSRCAKVYRDSEWDEYHVKHYKDGKHQTKADYHTDDKDDAHGTAKHFVKEDSEQLTEAPTWNDLKVTKKHYDQAVSEHPNVVGHYTHPDHKGKSFELRAHKDGERHVMLNTTDEHIHGGFMGDNTAHVHKALTHDFDHFRKVKGNATGRGGKGGGVSEETDIEEGKTFKVDDEGNYASAKAIRDKIKKFAKERKGKDAKKNIEEDLYPEVRTLNKKKAQ